MSLRPPTLPPRPTGQWLESDETSLHRTRGESDFAESVEML